MSTLIDALKGLQSELEAEHEDSYCLHRLGLIIAEHEQSGWRPIESAPKDGSELILLEAGDSYAGYFSHAPNYWNEIGWYPSIDIAIEHSSHPDHPTHWQPLPKGPGEA